jgi:hypothetical protein
MSCFLDTGLGNLWEVPMEGSHRGIRHCMSVIFFITILVHVSAYETLVGQRRCQQLKSKRPSP